MIVLLYFGDLITHLIDDANDFMTRNQRILAILPFVFNSMNITKRWVKHVEKSKKNLTHGKYHSTEYE